MLVRLIHTQFYFELSSVPESVGFIRIEVRGLQETEHCFLFELIRVSNYQEFSEVLIF